MRFMQLLCVAITLVGSAGALAQTIYKWTDAKGATHYSDQPGPNAVEVQINAQTYAEENSAEASAPPDDTPRAPANYQELQIQSPAQEETIFGASAQINVQLSLEPGLQSGHFVQVTLDGATVSGENSTALSYSLPEVERGEHTLQAQIVDAAGAVQISSASVTFYVRAPSVIKPR